MEKEPQGKGVSRATGSNESPTWFIIGAFVTVGMIGLFLLSL